MRWLHPGLLPSKCNYKVVLYSLAMQRLLLAWPQRLGPCFNIGIGLAWGCVLTRRREHWYPWSLLRYRDQIHMVTTSTDNVVVNSSIINHISNIMMSLMNLDMRVFDNSTFCITFLSCTRIIKKGMKERDKWNEMKIKIKE